MSGHKTTVWLEYSEASERLRIFLPASFKQNRVAVKKPFTATKTNRSNSVRYALRSFGPLLKSDSSGVLTIDLTTTQARKMSHCLLPRSWNSAEAFATISTFIHGGLLYFASSSLAVRVSRAAARHRARAK